MNAVFPCPGCGKQNFIARERFDLLDTAAFHCWRCGAPISKEWIVAKAGHITPHVATEDCSMQEVIVVYVTAGNEEEAVRIAKALVEERLVACANIIPNIRSLYRWKGDLCDEQEVLILLKSVKRHVARIIKRVQELHSYEVPEILSHTISEGNEAYMKWVEDETA